MNPLPPAADVKIAPADVLSSIPFAFWRVLAWSLWSPRTFIRYVNWLLKSPLGESPFPKQLERQQLQNWWDKNQHQRTLVGLAVEVGIFVIFGLIFAHLLYVVALAAVDPVQVVWRVVFFCTVFFVFWLISVGWSFRAATLDGNVGLILVAALPRGIAIAFGLLILCWWSYIDYFFAAEWSLRAAIFLMWGYGLGFCVNHALAMWQQEVVHLRTFAGWYSLVCAAILLILLAAHGGTAFPPLTSVIIEHEPALWATLSACVGLLAGLLRPLEYLLLLGHPAPEPDQRTHERTWMTPGSTLLPAYRMQWALESWLDEDRDEGVYIASQLSQASHQQQPLILPLQRQLAVCETDEIVEIGLRIYDSGAKYAAHVVAPPLASRAKTETKRAKGQDRRTYEHEAALANVLRARRTPPEFKLDGDANTVEAMLWYYNQGYPYWAARVWRQAGGKNGAIARSSPRMAELGALIETFEALVDLDAASTTANFQLPERPARRFRNEAWMLIDQLATAARWAWRARHCTGQQRRDCREKFDTMIGQAALQAKSMLLAERNLVLCITGHWQTQFNKLLRDGKVESGFEPVKIRPWESMHGELDDLDPWGQLRIELHKRWQPGYTVITVVDGLPNVEADAAVRAAASDPLVTAWAPYDLKDLPNDPVTARLFAFKSQPNDSFITKLLADICKTVAVALKPPTPLPVGLASLKPASLRDEIDRLCAQAPATRVVMYIENARRLVNDSVSPRISQLVLRELGALEQRNHNLALTLECGSGQEMAGELRRKIGAAGLKTETVCMPLLSLEGVQRWLKLQFDAAGVYFEDEAAARVYRLTGGHSYLLQHLGACVADNYNNHFPSSSPCPVIDLEAVNRASESTRYREPLEKLSQAVLDKYGYDDKRRRLMLKLLSEFADDDLLADPAGFESHGTADVKLPVIYVQEVLIDWEKVGLVEQFTTPTFYRLRCQSLSQPLMKLLAKRQ